MNRGLAWLVGGLTVLAASVVQAAVDIEGPFVETGTQIWDVVIPVTLGIISAFALWMSWRAGHMGIFMAMVGIIIAIFFTGAIPELIADAGLNWPF